MDGPILVTGAAGFAGSHLLDLLRRDRPAAPIVAWRRSRDRPAADDGGVSWRAVDILDRRAVAAAIADIQPSFVYHCAGAAHVGRAWEHTAATLAVNVRGTDNVLSALEALGGGRRTRMLVPSSALVYRPEQRPLTEDDALVPAGPYGLSKLAQEMVAAHALADGIEVVVARAFNHVGPRQDPSFAGPGFARQIAAIERGQMPPVIQVGNLEARRDITDVRDTVRAYRAMIERGVPGRAYNVCSGRALAIRDMLRMLLERARVPIQIRVDETRLRPSDVPLLLGDPSRLRRELGWGPEIPIERTVDDLLAYWRGRQE